jgi:hypothetical protein
MNPLVVRAKRSKKDRLLRRLIVDELLSAGEVAVQPLDFIVESLDVVARHEIRPAQPPTTPAPVTPGSMIPLPGHPSLN